MNPSQDRPTFVIPSVPADLTTVEAAAALVARKTSMEDRATVVGLKCHSRISAREGLATSGQVDGYVEAYPAHYLLRLAKAAPVLRAAIIEFLNDTACVVDHEPVEKDLNAFATRVSHELGEIIASLADQKISRIEAAQRDTALQLLQEHIHRVRIKLGKVARGGRS